MSSKEQFEKHARRLESIEERCLRLWQKALEETETHYLAAVRELQDDHVRDESKITQEIERLKGEHEIFGKEFSQKKYHLEKEANADKADMVRMQGELEQINMKYTAEAHRLKEEQTRGHISYEKQKSALNDLYQEKRRSLLVAREKLIQQAAQSAETLRTFKEKYSREMETKAAMGADKVGILRDQVQSKRQGWEMALETIRRDRDVLAKQKEEIQKRLSEVTQEKEREMEELRVKMQVAREQLELDKAALIEKAEDDQRKCEADVQNLQSSITLSDSELQTLILEKDKRVKDLEDGFSKEEELLKETVKSETEKRDYEQKLFAQEKAQKELELNGLKEEYEKKKWNWENQVRTLLVQKSVQDAEHDAERLRVDREARVLLRSLEAKRDELKQKLSDIKSRHENLVAHSKKEEELLNQRWNWRKERLWSMWQNRLEILKKERSVLHEQLENLEAAFTKERAHRAEEEQRQEKRIGELQQGSMQSSERHVGYRKQREIQLELEKTRLIAQIKECETIINDWMSRQKTIQEEVAKRGSGFQEQMTFLDRYFKEEEHETELFLHVFRKALASVEGAMTHVQINKHAA
jgi:hypothetical protein